MSSLPTSQRCWAYEYARLEPKGTWSGAGVLRSPVAVVAPPAEWQDLPHTGIRVERDKPIIFPMGRTVARPTDEIVGKGGWKKRMPYCNDMDRGSNFASHESGPTSNWCLFTRTMDQQRLCGKADDGRDSSSWCAYKR